MPFFICVLVFRSIADALKLRLSILLPIPTLRVHRQAPVAQDYDKILRENVGQFLLSVSERLFGFGIAHSTEVKDTLPTTLSKEPDFLRIVEPTAGHPFLLHLEFQTADTPDMVFRMQEYFVLLRRKFNLPVRQFVLYLGNRPARMPTQLPPEEVFEGFILRSLHQYDYRQPLASVVPEEVLLAVLSDFGKERAEVVVGQIIRRLVEISGTEKALRKYVRQLLVLARLRKLSIEVKKQLRYMPIEYDIRQDAFYQQGIAEGKAEGIAEGKAEMIRSLLADGTLPIEKIAQLARVPLDVVQRVARQG